MTVDLDFLEETIRLNEARNLFVAPVIKEMIAELRELREQRRVDNEEAARVYDFARDKGQARERDAVVAYLLAGTADCAACMDEAVVRLAREIERGEHRREEER